MINESVAAPPGKVHVQLRKAQPRNATHSTAVVQRRSKRRNQASEPSDLCSKGDFPEGMERKNRSPMPTQIRKITAPRRLFSTPAQQGGPGAQIQRNKPKPETRAFYRRLPRLIGRSGAEGLPWRECAHTLRSGISLSSRTCGDVYSRICGIVCSRTCGIVEFLYAA